MKSLNSVFYLAVLKNVVIAFSQGKILVWS